MNTIRISLHKQLTTTKVQLDIQRFLNDNDLDYDVDIKEVMTAYHKNRMMFTELKIKADNIATQVNMFTMTFDLIRTDAIMFGPENIVQIPLNMIATTSHEI